MQTDNMAEPALEKFKASSPSAGKDVEDVVSGQTTPEVILSKHGLRLHPQPVVSDPLDPLNWSTFQKHSILAIVMALYFMFTYITTTTVPSFPSLEEHYTLTIDQLNWTVAVPALGLSVGPLFWSSFADIYGRRPIFLLGTIIALASTVGAALAPGYGGYMAARFFQGFGVSPAASVGLAIIGDCFFENERGQKVGMWVLAIDLGLLAGPLIGGFPLFPLQKRKENSPSQLTSLRYWWVLSVITLIPVAYETFSPQSQGLLFLGLIIGTLISEVLCSGRLSDWLVLRLTKRNAGVKEPEMRLWLAYPAALISGIGLIVWGISVDRQWHWMVGQVAFVLFGAGIQMGNTAVCSYIVDAYPLQSMAVIVFYSVMLNLSAFVDPFFIFPWVDSVGFTWTMAGHAIITVFFCIPTIGLLHVFGGRLREKNGSPDWVNPEFDHDIVTA
ncbi:hypothetical protein NLU13_0919 [Sarocladium strictum]|uniref:Major facilitator superfamily (MFS) profile domain-containing protein n=1 Tax=Sarocladium strictum TaxID=5046 RepID=A0AA39GRW7_SARSR|nr:hypothetical protein NLU13_0919 [Sarocladium strictum]